jgi:DNA-binding transcriptional regulator YhcF (GntR family)
MLYTQLFFGEFKESKSIYLQIVDRICDEILQGQDIIYNKRGLGYFVALEGRERILKLRKEVFLRDELPEFFRQLKTLDIPMKEIEKMYKEYIKNGFVIQTTKGRKNLENINEDYFRNSSLRSE